jgi:hypothetical protein
VPRAAREVERLQGLARDNLLTALARLRDAAVLREDLDPELGARLLQDLEIASLVKCAQALDLEGALGRQDWRRTLGMLVRGMRRPVSLAPRAAIA